MLHIATVHFESSCWIPIQARELNRHLQLPYQTWSSLQGIDRSYAKYFDHVFDQGGEHAGKLNHLALEIAQRAKGDDLLMFIDGDAFPIADPAPLIASGLETAPLLAVRRIENAKDAQPHPCFCVTRVETWRDLGGDWSAGYAWPGAEGKPMSDVGANLLRRLEITGMPWAEVLRTNRRNLHPVFFAIYGGAIYHHGAGFRTPLSRADAAALRHRRHAGPVRVPYRLAKKSLMQRNRRQSQTLFRRIQRDDPDWLGELA